MVSGNTYPQPMSGVWLVLTLVLAGSLMSVLGVRVMHGPLYDHRP